MIYIAEVIFISAMHAQSPSLGRDCRSLQYRGGVKPLLTRALLASLLLSDTVVAFARMSTTLASATCDMLSAKTDITIEYASSNLEYLQDQSEYWSSACGDLLPTCIIVPKTADEVSTIIQTLTTNHENFSVKAGGHNANQNFSSIAGGPLINLKALNEVNYDPSSGTVQVGPGNRWTSVVEALQPYNVTVVGGRIGHVGVGGYIVGGGLSYLSTQYGWAMNNVASFEVVLANGTIVNASSTANPDLFNVLKGGGNNFGIVTTYTLQVHPMGQIWAGNLVFSSAQTDQVLAAVRNFTENYPDDKAAIIATNEITLSSLLNVWLLFVFYDGQPPPGTFDMFTDIGPLLNTAGPTEYSDFISAEDDVVITGQVYQITTEMSPLPPNTSVGSEVMRSYYNHFLNIVNSLAGVPGLVATMALQPLPKRLAQKAISNGGDLLDLDPVDRMLFEFDFSYDFTASTLLVDPAIKALFSGMRERVLAFMANGTIPNVYVPLFMNDANHQQDYFGRLRPETLQYAEEIRQKYDPLGFFKERTSGFKL